MDKLDSLKELSVDEFPLVKPLFGDFENSVPLNGVLDGRHTGRVFVDDKGTPSIAYVWTPWGYHYLAGTPQDNAFLPAIKIKIETELQPESAANGESDILLTHVPDAWESRLGDILPTPQVIKIFRRSFVFNRQKFQVLEGYENHKPHGLRMVRIDVHLASRVTDAICATWRSVEEFCEDGFGYCLLDGENIVSVCTSAFIARGKVEIGVHTDEKFRRLGYASLTAAALIEHCLDNDLAPNWECFWDNVPSVALAHKLGFEMVKDVPIYYWEGPKAS